MRKEERLQEKKRVCGESVIIFSLFIMLIAMLSSMGVVNAEEIKDYGVNNPRKNADGSVTYDCVYFGNIAQSNTNEEQKEPIKWRVLSVNGNDAFLMADQIVSFNPYYYGFETGSWETSTVRKSLNGLYNYDFQKRNSFFYKAFTTEEQNAIKVTKVVNSTNLENGVSGNDTEDKVYVLSVEEATNPDYGFNTDILVKDPARVRINTSQVSMSGKENEVGAYWLRTECVSNKSYDYEFFVDTEGQEGYIWSDFLGTRMGICPVLHLKLDYKTGEGKQVWTNVGTVSTDGTETGCCVNHSWNNGVETKAPTCTKDGEFTYTCKVCKQVKKKAIPEFGHKFAEGVVVVKATATKPGKKTYKCTVCGEVKEETVPFIPVASIRISGMSKKIAAGKKIALSAKILPINASCLDIKWSSSNKKYATVSKNGVVKTKKAGIGKTVKITACSKDGKKIKKVYKIKIVRHAVKKVKMLTKSKSITVGKKKKLKVKVTTSGKTANKKLLWQSNNKEFATVNRKGVVIAKEAGKGKTVIITVKSTDGTNKKDKVKLTIK